MIDNESIKRDDGLNLEGLVRRRADRKVGETDEGAGQAHTHVESSVINEGDCPPSSDKDDTDECGKHNKSKRRSQVPT